MNQELVKPNFMPELVELEGKTLLDAGCGAGLWSIFAAEHGSEVHGVALPPRMIELANDAIAKANLAEKVSLTVGDVSSLPYESAFFDQAISINVGYNLPSDVLLGHFLHMSRVLKSGGKGVITAPASFATVFINGTSADQHIIHAFPSSTGA